MNSTNISLNTTDDCPCLSGKTIAVCCGKNGQLFRRAVSTKPMGGQTFYSHPKCYAKATSDCSNKISKEHYFSRTILEAMSPLSGVEGFTWLDGRVTRIPISGMAVNILCTRHNSALSPLDARAGQFHRELVNLKEFFDKGAPTPRIRLFSGDDLELWSLKLLCGLVAAKVADHSGDEITIEHQLARWSRVLFGDLTFTPRIGLYAYVPLLRKTMARNQMGGAVISNPESGVYGLKVTLIDKMFILVLTFPSDPLPEDSLLRDSIYHPAEFIQSTQRSRAHFLFSWNSVTTRKAITWEYAKPLSPCIEGTGVQNVRSPPS